MQSHLEPCRLCLSPAPLCKFILTNRKGCTGNIAIDINASSCLNLIKISISVATKCSDASPCTNHPMHCPYCPHSSLAVWSYNFCQHLLQHHPTVSLKKHSSILTLSKLERDGMKRIWDQRHEQPKCHHLSMWRNCSTMRTTAHVTSSGVVSLMTPASSMTCVFAKALVAFPL